MNYFELYEIPVSFKVDETLVKKKHLALSEHHHAGSQSQATDQKHLTLLNKAYKTLTDEEATMRYVLQIKNLLKDEETYRFDPEFQLEVGGINQEMMELELDETREQLTDVAHKTNQVLLKIYEDVTEIIETYRESVTTEEELLQVKDFYYKKKYLERILDRINGIRNIASPQ